jgi:hypothetical protein
MKCVRRNIMVERGTKHGYADRFADDDFTLTMRDCLYGKCRPAVDTAYGSFVNVLKYSYRDAEIVRRGMANSVVIITKHELA